MTVHTRSRSNTYTSSFNIKTAVQLYNHKYPLRDWLLEPWLRQRMLVLVHAPTGVGKSWFCWSLALGVASGKGFADWPCTKARKVLVIDGEMQPDDLQDRFKFLIKKSNFTKLQKRRTKKNFLVIARQDQEIDTVFPDLNDPEDQPLLLEEIRVIDPDLVILDNLSTLANLEDENAASSYNNLFDFLAKIKQERSAIVVHHDRKGTDKNTSEGYRGSSKMAAIMEQRISISAVESAKKPKHGGACFYTEFKKNRYIGDESLKRRMFTLIPTKGWIVEKDEDETLISVAEAVKSAEFTTQAQLANHFGHKKAWASKRIRKCVIEGLLADGDWLKYCQKAKEKKALDEMSDKDLNKLKL